MLILKTRHSYNRCFSRGVRGCALPVTGGLKRVTALASRGLSPIEKNYHAHKLEFLALKWALTDKFHDYLYGNTFDVRTDNNLFDLCDNNSLSRCYESSLASLSLSKKYSFMFAFSHLPKSLFSLWENFVHKVAHIL